MTTSKSPFPLQKVSDNDFSLHSNEKLCEIIVAGRYLGIMQDQMVAAMTELAKRREQGDQFNYEDHIEATLKTLPEINLDLSQILKKFAGLKL
jgi:hypothetical protein